MSDLKIKNKELSDLLKYCGKEPSTANVSQAAKVILSGYLSSLFEVADDPNVQLPLDLTYDTIQNIPQGIGYVFSTGTDNSTEKNLETAEKTMAAYLMGLAMNEEGASLSYSLSPVINRDTISSPSSWSGIEILCVKNIKKIDFLKSIHGCISYKNEILTIYQSSVISTYQELTGVDLGTYGLEDVQFSLKGD